MIWDLNDDKPQLAEDAWVAPDAQIIGKVVLDPRLVPADRADG